jgi:predicted glycoside hydrolase/deacetylase ChbG (UPF0249 family)
MKVIFHGDDFGLTSGVNEGIIHAYREGLLASTSLIAGGEAAQEAISLAKENPGLDMGVHLVLCDEPPVLHSKDLSSIISSGTCFPSRNHILKAILSGRIDYREVEAEWHAQVETILNAGLRVGHLDSHQFVHLFPGLLAVCLNMVKKYHIPFVRGLIDDPASLKYGLKRFIQWMGLALWTRSFVSRSLPSHVGIVSSVGFLGAGGRLNKEMLLKTLDALRFKTSTSLVEVILHPGTGDAHTLNKYRDWDYDWKKDLDLITDRALKKDLDLRGITTTSFGKER